jgi:hypothetical protein
MVDRNSGDPDSHDAERRALRVERDRLEQESEFLVSETKRLQGSKDSDALRILTERLQQHQADVRAYTVVLEDFHRRVGPLGK